MADRLTTAEISTTDYERRSTGGAKYTLRRAGGRALECASAVLVGGLPTICLANISQAPALTGLIC